MSVSIVSPHIRFERTYFRRVALVRLKRKTLVSAAVAVVSVEVALAILAAILKSDQYSAFTGAVQAGFVVPALIVGLGAFLNDRHDRRVDRVLAFHQELMSGEVQEARTFVAKVLRANAVAGKIQPVRRQDLEDEGQRCVRLILRFFERVNAAMIADSIDQLLLAELIGRHAGWWDIAIMYEPENPRSPLHNFAKWANGFAKKNKHPYFNNWGVNRANDFDDGVLKAYRSLCEATPSTATPVARAPSAP